MKKKPKPPGNPPSVSREQGLVPLSCPDCFGVLRVEREGQGRHWIYRCQVDHRYSLQSLLHAMETHLERSLWSASLLLKQMGVAYEDLLADGKRPGAPNHQEVRRRIGELKKQCAAIRTMIESSHAVE
jgi:hypothetical protein